MATVVATHVVSNGRRYGSPWSDRMADDRMIDTSVE